MPFVTSRPDHANSLALWTATGSAFVGTILGGLAVWLGTRVPAAVPTSGPAAPAPAGAVQAAGPDVPFVGESRRGASTASPLVQAVASTRSSVVSIKIGYDIHGAGVIVGEKGGILTNYHVIEPALRASMLVMQRGAEVVEPSVIVRFIDGRELRAHITLWDVDQDIAMLQIVDAIADERFSAVSPGASARLRVGEDIFVVGCPLGLEHTVSRGIVSALDRTDQLANPQLPAIQIDAAINVGNSGGPVFNLHGELVGITTTRARNGDGIGFAIPIDRILAFMDTWDSGERWAEIGIEVATRGVQPQAIERLGYVQGIAVTTVFEGPARRAGMQAGDVIVELRGRRFDAPDPHEQTPSVLMQFQRVVRALIPGEMLALTVVRSGELVELTVQTRAISGALHGMRLAHGILGLELDRTREEGAFVRRIVDGSPLDRLLGRSTPDPRARASMRERLEGARIVAIGSFEIDGLERVGSVLSQAQGWVSRGTSPRVRVSFIDKDGKRLVIPAYPIVSN